MDPEREHDDDQAWYWTDAWQEAEREADENLLNGDYDVFKPLDDFVNDFLAFWLGVGDDEEEE